MKTYGPLKLYNNGRIAGTKKFSVDTEMNLRMLLQLHCTTHLSIEKACLPIVDSLIVGWRRGSVVRTSVCSGGTFPDLRLIHG